MSFSRASRRIEPFQAYEPKTPFLERPETEPEWFEFEFKCQTGPEFGNPKNHFIRSREAYLAIKIRKFGAQTQSIK